MLSVNWGEPERAPVLSVSHGTYVRCTKISCKKRKAPHLVDEMVRTSDARKFPVAPHLVDEMVCTSDARKFPAKLKNPDTLNFVLESNTCLVTREKEITQFICIDTFYG